jgi:hypothetical protein
VRNRRFVLITLTVVVLLLAGSGLAVASSDVPVAAAEEELDTTYGDLIGWLDELPPLVWWFLPKEGDTEEEPAPDCTGATGSGTDETTPSVTEVELVPGCHVVPIVETDGNLTHGSVVSAFVHALKDALAKAEVDYDGPKGQLVRDIARSNLGKDLADLDGSGDDGGVELEAAGEAEEDEDRSGPPDHARGQGHGKKDKPNKKPKK